MKSLPYSAPLIIAGVALALYACSADGSAPPRLQHHAMLKPLEPS